MLKVDVRGGGGGGRINNLCFDSGGWSLHDFMLLYLAVWVHDFMFVKGHAAGKRNPTILISCAV